VNKGVTKINEAMNKSVAIHASKFPCFHLNICLLKLAS
jgi:hypothetical protein